MAPLTRKEFYELAIRCRQEAFELARHDQTRVNLERCRHFNAWLAELRQFDQLAPHLQKITPARPINRWMLMGLAVLLWLALSFTFGQSLGPNGLRLLTLAATGTIILLFFLPESLYGTTVELLEGKVLRIVEVLEQLLFSSKMELTEAVFFQVKENLEAARLELRQQIHLAHST
jgi:hypothetical protein